MSDAQIHPIGVEPAPADYKIPDSAELVLKSVRASFDGSGAAGPFIPLLRIISDAGSITDEIPQDVTVAAGGSADATWFPHVGGGKAAVASTSAAFARAYLDGVVMGTDPPQVVNANSSANGQFPHASTTDATVMSWRTVALQNDTLDLTAAGTYLCWVTTHWEIIDLNLSSILMNFTQSGFPHTPWEPEKVPRFGDAIGSADNMDMNVLHVITGGNSVHVHHSNNTGFPRSVEQCYFTVVYLATT